MRLGSCVKSRRIAKRRGPAAKAVANQVAERRFPHAAEAIDGYSGHNIPLLWKARAVSSVDGREGRRIPAESALLRMRQGFHLIEQPMDGV